MLPIKTSPRSSVWLLPTSLRAIPTNLKLIELNRVAAIVIIQVDLKRNRALV